MLLLKDNPKHFERSSIVILLSLNVLYWILFFCVVIGIIISFFNLYELPDPDKFLMVFFKEPFIMILGLYTAWFISSFR